MAVVEDITERKQAVEALRESQALLSFIGRADARRDLPQRRSGTIRLCERVLLPAKSHDTGTISWQDSLGTGLEDAALAESGAGHHVQIMENGKADRGRGETQSAQMAGSSFSTW